MYGRHPAMAERGSAVWPVAEGATPAPPDGLLPMLSTIFAAARRQKGRFALWVLFCIGTAAFYAFTATPTYTASSMLLLEPRRQSAQLTQDTVVAAGLDISRAESEMQVIRSERLLANVFGSLNLAESPEFNKQSASLFGSLRGAIGRLFGIPPEKPAINTQSLQTKFETFMQRVGVRRVGQSYVIEISYVANDPDIARRVANAAASAYLWQSITAKADAAKNGAEFLQGRLNALSAEARASAAAVAAGTLPEAPTPDADARIIGAALQPLKPSAPQKGLIMALGAIIGLIGGFMGIAIGQVFDRRVRTPQDIARQVGLPCLAALPDFSRRSSLPWNRPAGISTDGQASNVSFRSAFTQGIRELRAAIQLAAAGRPGEIVIAIVACAPGAGTSLIGYQLASLIRDGEHPVTLIDGNVHGTAIWPPAGRGPHEADCLADILHNGGTYDETRVLDREGISLIPGRSMNPEVNRRAYLGTSALKNVIDRVRQKGAVILDLPALSTATESRAAARRADVVVIVAEAGRTTADEIISAAASLRNVGANVVGVVLNRV